MMTSKKIGIILMLAFIITLGIFTVYSRAYLQRQKPLVKVTFPEATTLIWNFETRSTIEEAASEFAAQGIEWTIDVYIPRSAFEGYLSAPYRVFASAATDSVYLDEDLRRIYREALDCGGYLYVFEYVSQLREQYNMPYVPGEGVTVHLEHVGADFIFEFMLPLSSIHYDLFTGDEYFFIVNRRSGAWGWEYYVSQHTAQIAMPRIINGMVNVIPLLGVENTPIIYWSEWELYDGALIRLWD
jgi:hypothetical protein